MRRLRTQPKVSAARSLLALWLAFTALAGAAPAGVSFAAGDCAMPCCRARTRADCPSCHHKRKKKSAARSPIQHDPVCGARLKLGLSRRQELSAQTVQLASAGAGAVHRPCPSDCCGLLTSLTQHRRGRDESVAAQGIRPPPLSAAARAPRPRRAAANTSELCPRCSPRAPPSDTPSELAVQG